MSVSHLPFCSKVRVIDIIVRAGKGCCSGPRPYPYPYYIIYTLTQPHTPIVFRVRSLKKKSAKVTLNRSLEFKGVIVQIVCAIGIKGESA